MWIKTKNGSYINSKYIVFIRKPYVEYDYHGNTAQRIIIEAESVSCGQIDWESDTPPNINCIATFEPNEMEIANKYFEDMMTHIKSEE